MADLQAQAVERAKQRPWYRLHVATWIGLILVVGALSYGNARPRCSPIGGGGSLRWQFIFHEYGLGWPTEFVEGNVTETFVYSYSGPSPMSRTRELTQRETSLKWNATRLAVNLLVGLVILGSTGVLVESRLRSRRKWHQFTLENVFILTAAAALFFGLFYSKDTLEPALGMGPFVNRITLSFNRDQTLQLLAAPFPVWISIPLLFGIGCTLYVAVWMSFCLPGGVFKRTLVFRSLVGQRKTRR